MIFLVAEIGVNWDGDFKLVREMIENAKEAGFNAVKFQAYNKEIIKDHPEVNRLIKCAISAENIDEINNMVIDFKKIKDIVTTETLIEVEVNQGW